VGSRLPEKHRNGHPKMTNRDHNSTDRVFDGILGLILVWASAIVVGAFFVFAGVYCIYKPFSEAASFVSQKRDQAVARLSTEKIQQGELADAKVQYLNYADQKIMLSYTYKDIFIRYSDVSTDDLSYVVFLVDDTRVYKKGKVSDGAFNIVWKNHSPGERFFMFIICPIFIIFGLVLEVFWLGLPLYFGARASVGRLL
jgi:hypothetical protein